MNEEYQTRQFFNNDKLNSIDKKVKKLQPEEIDLKPIKPDKPITLSNSQIQIKKDLNWSPFFV